MPSPPFTKGIAGPRAGASKVTPIDDSDDDVEDSGDSDSSSRRLKITTHKKQKFPAKLIANIPAVDASEPRHTGGRLKWSVDEENALLEGVRTHGLGSWSIILEDPRFSGRLTHRSNVDIKDKYRNLSKKNPDL
jgi:hypothetical protein